MKSARRTPRPLQLTPEEYLHHARRGLDKFGFHAIPLLVVKGDIVVDEKRVASPRTVSLPPARVLGDVRVRGLSSLESCSLEVEGNLEIVDCPNIIRLSGRATTAIIEGAGLESVGADFECREDMKIRDTPGLSRLNCRVGRTLFLKGEFTVSAGPAFACWGLVLDGGASLVDASGRRHGGSASSPPQLIRGGRLLVTPSHARKKSPPPRELL
jgi:hypothetical protein